MEKLKIQVVGVYKSSILDCIKEMISLAKRGGVHRKAGIERSCCVGKWGFRC